MEIFSKRYLRILFGICLIAVSFLIHTNVQLGQFGCCQFSLISIMGPLLGLFFGFGEMALIVAICAGISCFFSDFSPMLALTFGFPTLAAASILKISQSSEDTKKLFNQFFDFALRVLVPSAMISLFVFHSEGQNSKVYTLYWIIPMFCYVWQKARGYSNKTIGTQTILAISSTFVAHSIGSVIYLYSFNIPSDIWLTLIPIVALERITNVLGILFVQVLVIKLNTRVVDGMRNHSFKTSQ